MLASFNHLINHRGPAAIVLLALFAGSVAASDKIEWRTDYDEARREATSKAKPLFLDFGTEDCLHCRRMHQTTFRDPAIVRMIGDNFIPLKIDGNREPRLVQALRIQAYPTMILAGHDGKILGYIEGYIEVGRLSEQLQRAAAIQVPDWAARDFKEAIKCRTTEDYVGAISRLRKIVEEAKDKMVVDKSKEVLQEIEDKAAALLKEIKEMEDKGRASDTLALLTDLTGKFAGTQAATDGLKLKLNKSGDSELRAKRAKQLLADARRDFDTEHYLDCLRKCEALEEAYRGTPEAKDGAFLVKQINASTDKLAAVLDAMNDELAIKYVKLADSYIEKTQNESAKVCLDRAIKLNPSKSVVSLAQARLMQIDKTPGTKTSFPKPE